MLKFNSSGLLIPDTRIKSSIEELKEIFVSDIESNTRKEIFENYINYSEELKRFCKADLLLQWIDGSFTTRKRNPNDIDLVTFLDYKIVQRNKKKLENFKFPNAAKIYKVDAYLIEVYPDGHKNDVLYLSDRAYWMDQFTKTKRNRKGDRYFKGFLEVNF